MLRAHLTVGSSVPRQKGKASNMMLPERVPIRHCHDVST